MQRLRLGRLAGLLLAGCWLLTLGLSLASDRAPGRTVVVLVAFGVCNGLALSRRAWDEAPQHSVRLLVATTGLHAIAAMIALHGDATVCWPLFVLAGVLAGGLLHRPIAVLAHAGALADAAIVVALVAPGRAPHALDHAAVLAPVVMLAAAIAAFLRSRAEVESRLRVVLGDTGAVHAALARRLAADPDRIAHLAMGLDLQAGRGLGTADGARVIGGIARSLAEHDTPAETAATAAVLAEHLGRALEGAEAAERDLDDLPPAAPAAPQREREPEPEIQLDVLPRNLLPAPRTYAGARAGRPA